MSDRSRFKTKVGMGHREVKGDTMESKRVVKTRRIGLLNWILLAVFCIGIPSFVHADISDILLNFYPYITAQEEYSTNIFLSPNQSKLDDYITTVTPGLAFRTLKAGAYWIDLDVNGGYNYYAKNHDFSYWSAFGRLDTWYALTPALTFRLRDSLVRSDAVRENLYDSNSLYNAEGQYIGDTLPDQYLSSTIRGVQAIYVRNVVEPSLEYRFGRENLASLRYRNNIYRNQDDTLYEDSTENTINPLVNYWFDINNGITVEYILTFGQFQRSPNLIGHEIRDRYTYRFNPKLSVFGEYIFIRDDFERPGVDYDIHNPSLGIEYKFSPTLIGTLQGGYFWNLGADDSESRGPSFLVSLTQRGQKTSYSLIGEGGYTQDYFTAENLGYEKYYRAYGTINHRLTQRLSAQLTGSIDRVWYPNDPNNRKDWISDGRVSVSYELFRWLTLTLEGRYRECRSTTESFDYTEYAGIFRITVARPGYQSMGPSFEQRSSGMRGY